MAGSVNKVVLVGRLGKDPEVRPLNNGGKVVTLSVATSESWQDKQSNERKEKTEWHSVVVWNERTAEFAEKYLTKGALVYVEGQLETRKFTDNSGADRYKTEVVLRPFRGELTSLSSDGQQAGGQQAGQRSGGYQNGNGNGGGRSSNGYRAGPTQGERRQAPQDGGYGGGPQGGALDDEIPF